MVDFNLTILGSNSATPAYGRHLSAQVLQIHNDLFLIDCGEGTQFQMQRFKIKKQRINHIFISHLHGDHIFGLIGLIMSMDLNGREAPLHIYSPEGLQPIIDVQWGGDGNFEIIFHTTDPEKRELVFENSLVQVFTIPLIHRIPCNGYLFIEKQGLPNIRPEKIEEYRIHYLDIAAIKAGGDYVLEGGAVIPHQELVIAPPKPRSFAYCSDTVYSEAVISHVQGVDLLYHEATFLHEAVEKAKKTMHTTALQAGQVAAAANVKRMVIGHFSSRYPDPSVLVNEARTLFKETYAAKEGVCESI